MHPFFFRCVCWSGYSGVSVSVGGDSVTLNSGYWNDGWWSDSVEVWRLKHLIVKSCNGQHDCIWWCSWWEIQRQTEAGSSNWISDHHKHQNWTHWTLSTTDHSVSKSFSLSVYGEINISIYSLFSLKMITSEIHIHFTLILTY